MAARELMRNFLRFVWEGSLIRTFIQTLEEHLAQHGGNVESNQSIVAGEELPKYGDVVSEDWFPRLYQRIESIIEVEGPLRFMELRVALESRLEGTTLRANEALNLLANFTNRYPHDYMAHMTKLFAVIYKELTGTVSER